MIDKFQYIQINNAQYDVNDLLKLCDEKITNLQVQCWEKEIYLFLQDWFSQSKTIQVLTSGSTGSPKEIILQKKHMVASAKATLRYFNLKKNDTAWLCLPVKYIAGRMMIVRSIVGGINLLYSEPNSLPSIDFKRKIDFAAMVPNQVFSLLNNATLKQQLLKIDKLLIGGSFISRKLEDNLLEIPNLKVWYSYGMTETITHIALRRIKKGNYINRYYPLDGRIVSTNNNSQLVIDAKEIGLRSLVTNDIGEIFEDGSFVIKGRIDNVIVSGGVKLFPEVIEEKITKFVSGRFFIGSIPDEKLGQKLLLFIEGTYMDKIKVDSLRNELKKNLQKFEVPKEIIMIPHFLKTETGKIARKDIVCGFLDKMKKE